MRTSTREKPELLQWRSRLVELFLGRRRRPRSLHEVLLYLLGRQRFQQLAPLIHDSRRALEQAGALLGIPEVELALAAARELRIPYLHRVPALDVSALPPGTTLSALRSAGAILLPESRGRYALVCCDPALAAGLFHPGREMVTYLSTWSNIAGALDASERRYLGQCEYAQRQRIEKLRGAAERVLEQVVREVRELRGQELVIEFGASQITYHAPSHAGRGSIDARVREPLLRQLKEWADKTRVAPCELAGEPVIVTEVSPAAAFGISLAGARYAAAEEKSGLPVPAGSKPAALPPAGKPGGKGKVRPDAKNLILVIDDNTAFVKVLQRFLERQELQVITAASGAAALEMLQRRREQPNLIVCDVHMPGMSGLDLLTQLKTLRPAGSPIIMLTSDDDIELELEALAAGADAFLVKNQDPRLLSAHVKRLLLNVRRMEAA